jgi:hypothetical protein
MSETSRKIMEQAIARHFAEEHEGAHYTDFILTVAGVELNGDRARAKYLMEHSPDIPAHVMLGLREISNQNMCIPRIDYDAQDMHMEYKDDNEL